MTSRRRSHYRLSEVRDLYLDYCSTRLSPWTVRRYRATRDAFVFAIGDPPIHTLRVQDIDAFMANRREPHTTRHGRVLPPVGNNTYNSYIRMIRPFIRWSYSRGYLPRDFSYLLRSVRRTHPDMKRLTEVHALTVLS